MGETENYNGEGCYGRTCPWRQILCVRQQAVLHWHPARRRHSADRWNRPDRYGCHYLGRSEGHLYDEFNGGDICDNCYDDDTGKALLDMCCKKSVDCGELATQWAIGVALAVIGFILALIATCGVCMCCCFGKEGAPSVALSGSPT